MYKKIDIPALLAVLALFILTGATVYLNYAQQKAVDRSKLPEKVELSKGFQKWITNLKNKGFEIEADEFRLKEENEIYNTTRMSVFSVDDNGIEEAFEAKLAEYKNIENQKFIEFSPSDRQFLDYRPEIRGERNEANRENEDKHLYNPNDVQFYGLRDDKVIEAKILSCKLEANCYFDRAYFIDNHVFVISEVSRPFERGQVLEPCTQNEPCIYTFKEHVIDLINNQDLIYESKPFEIVLSDKIEGF
ncbi:hypothetical protein KC980_01555 [candidate division WWE3 bacterium]|uniref:Uncharacterized protein n=1 Tax=candidate division WWE3 bacterium TaxID=2053526 RepID=A0A955ECR9_UNCKA|nr:hypothetical protein [candidate division WWE3 bacterium]